MIRNFFNKHKFIKVYQFNVNKTVSINYYRLSKFNPKYLVNPDHVFNHRGYQTIVIKDTSIETINPLDFESNYDESNFATAINSKIIRETFGTLKSEKIDMMKVIIFANLFISLVLLFLLLKEKGAI